MKNVHSTIQTLCYLLFLLYTLTDINRVYAQSSYQDYTVVPPAPGVAQFLDFKNYEVDHFHGIPEISHTLYELKSGAITVPIVLSYHGGGIRVEQKRGNAGMGWTVSFGATIGHTVYGAPDDVNDGGYLHGLSKLTYDEKQFRSKLIAKPEDYKVIGNGTYYKTNNNWQATYGERYQNGYTDVANDTYSLYGLGLSAVFAYAVDPQKGNVKAISSDSHLKIDKVNNPNQSNIKGSDNYAFRVKDAKGLTYDFYSQDRTEYKYSYSTNRINPSSDAPQRSVWYASAWHLDKITDKSYNTVQYFYAPSPNKHYKDSGSKVFKTYSSDQLQGTLPNVYNNVNSVYYDPVILNKITGNGISIDIKYKTVTDAYNNEPLIETLTITSPDNTQRVYKFNYQKYADKHSDYYLKSITDQGETIMQFSYDDTADGEMRLYYEDQDFGGYNNGAMNSDLIPKVKVGLESAIGHGSDRGVNPSAAKLGSLTKITYPTGGYTEFEWEGNEVQYVGPNEYSGGLDTTPLVNIYRTEEIRMSADESYKRLLISDVVVTDKTEIYVDLTKYFALPTEKLFNTDYYHSHQYLFDTPYPTMLPPNYPHLVFRRSDASRKVEKVFYLDCETIEEKGKNSPIKVLLNTPGTYEIELVNPLAVKNAEEDLLKDMQNSGASAGRIYVSIGRLDQVSTSLERAYWPGLRIRRIKSCAGDNGDVIRKDYFYNIGGEPDRTSATVRQLPKFYYQSSIYDNWNNGMVGNLLANVMCIEANPFPNTLFGPSSEVEYPQISARLSLEDRYDDSDDNLKSHLNSMWEGYWYSSSRDINNADLDLTRHSTYQPVGARTLTSRHYRRGNLLKSLIGTNGGSAGIERSIRYRILEPDIESLPILTTDAFVLCDYSRSPGVNGGFGGCDYGIGTYKILPYNKSIESETTFDSRGCVSYIEYKYFDNEYTEDFSSTLVKTSTTTNSEGYEKVVYYTYPETTDDFYDSRPETEVVVIGDAVVSATRTEYDSTTRLPLRTYELSGNVDLSKIKSSYKFTTSSQKTYINRPGYEYSYNSHGNLIEVKYRGEVIKSYIWGYNGLYPIIDASSLPYQDLRNALIKSLSAEEIDGQQACLQSKITNAVKSLRANLPTVEISSFAYHWLYGIIEQTDSRGISTYYKYDTRGRLTQESDYNHFLLNKYEYQYKNQ